MELIFKTKTYKTRTNKKATIQSNDPKNPRISINFTATVDPVPDTTLPFTYLPDKVKFTQKERKQEIIIENKSDKKLYLETVSGDIDNLKTKIKQRTLKPGKSTKIAFEWKGEFEKENLERSMTFMVSGLGITKFSIPLVVEGTDPTPPKDKAAVKKAAAAKRRAKARQKAKSAEETPAKKDSDADKKPETDKK